MKKILASLFILATSFCGMYADNCNQDDLQNEYNNILATNILNSLKTSMRSKDFLEWQIDGIKHMQKGLAIIVKQSKQCLSAQEQDVIKKILFALRDFFEVSIDFWTEMQLAKDSSEGNQIYNKFAEKLDAKRDALKNALDIFNHMPRDEQEQQANQFSSMVSIFMQRFCAAMSVALPVVADELGS